MPENKQNNTSTQSAESVETVQNNENNAPLKDQQNKGSDEQVETIDISEINLKNLGHQLHDLQDPLEFVGEITDDGEPTDESSKSNDVKLDEVATPDSGDSKQNKANDKNISENSSIATSKSNSTAAIPTKGDSSKSDHVSLGSTDLVFSELYESKKNIFLETAVQFLNKRCPLFILKRGQIQRLFFNSEHDTKVEELYELWKLGYRSPEMAKYFIHYFASCNTDTWKNTLFELLSYHDLPKNDKHMLKFLYQDVLNIKVSVGEFLGYYREDAPVTSLDISIEFNESRKRWSRQEYRYWTEKLSRSVGVNYDEELLLNTFNGIIENQATLLLQYSLMNVYHELFTEKWAQIIERQVFYHGEYTRLSQLSFQAPEYKYFVHKENLRDEKISWHAIELILKSKAYYPLHFFYLKYLSKNPDIKKVKLNQTFIFETLQNLTRKTGEENYVPQRIRYMLFLYFMVQDDWQNLSYSYDYLNSRFKRLLPRIFYARALFKRREYEKAWQHILEAWNENKTNLLLMNDAAVYAYHAGRLDEAEEIFHKMRAMFPNNPNVLYNESLFLQYKANIVRKEEIQFSRIEKDNELLDDSQTNDSVKDMNESDDLNQIAG